MKKIRLKKWVEVVLKLILFVDMFFMICGANDIMVMFIKTLITGPLAIVICLVLKHYNCLD